VALALPADAQPCRSRLVRQQGGDVAAGGAIRDKREAEWLAATGKADAASSGTE
jgi:hypothetical protein